MGALLMTPSRLKAAYPSLGGADCPVACAANTASFTSIYHVGTYAGAGADQFRANMLRAGNVLTSGAFGSNGTVIATESGRSKPTLATANLLENTGGVLQPPPPLRWGSEHPISVLSGRQPATSIYADGRFS